MLPLEGVGVIGSDDAGDVLQEAAQRAARPVLTLTLLSRRLEGHLIVARCRLFSVCPAPCDPPALPALTWPHSYASMFTATVDCHC